MKGVLVVAHGSRQEKTRETMEVVVGMARQSLPGVPLAVAYMEFCQPDIAAGLAALTDQGAEEIVVIPYFLFEGVHIHQDIPEEIRAFQETHPGVAITMGETLGADPRLADILGDRIRAAL